MPVPSGRKMLPVLPNESIRQDYLPYITVFNEPASPKDRIVALSDGAYDVLPVTMKAKSPTKLYGVPEKKGAPVIIQTHLDQKALTDVKPQSIMTSCLRGHAARMKQLNEKSQKVLAEKRLNLTDEKALLGYLNSSIPLCGSVADILKRYFPLDEKSQTVSKENVQKACKYFFDAISKVQGSVFYRVGDDVTVAGISFPDLQLRKTIKRYCDKLQTEKNDPKAATSSVGRKP